MADNRDQRLAFLREGHICTEWWKGCPECAKRLAEMERRYPKEEGQAERQ